jgi:ABC-2 type transport system permease protein
MNRYITLLKREYWEHRGGFLWAPIWTAAALLVMVFVGMGVASWHAARTFDGEVKIGVQLQQLLQKVPPEEMGKIVAGFEASLSSFWAILQVVLFFALFFYLLGALYDDRRDRSILFWKSLPVSDLETVLSKAVVALLGAPLIAWAVTVILHVVFLTLLSVFVLFHGLNAIDLVWGPAEPLSLAIRLLAIIPVNALWALPAVGWLLLVSAFARSKPFLWAVALPVAIGAAISVFDLLQALRIPDFWYWQHIVARILLSLVPAGWLASDFFARGGGLASGDGSASELVTWSMLGNALGSTELWVGVVAGVAMIAAAVYFRGNRELAD